MRNPNQISSAEQLADRIAKDPATSFWLRNSLSTALARDPVDAIGDAELLLSILCARLEEIQSN